MCIGFTILALLLRAPRVSADPPTIASVSQEISSADPAQLQQAIADIRTLLDAPVPATAVTYLQAYWFKPIMDAGRFDDAADLALRGELATPWNTVMVEGLQRERVQALIKAGRAQEALAAAKGLFNVSSMETTDKAVLTLAEALNAARPNDPGAVDRFKDEQVAGATTRPAEASTAHPGEVMASIHVDPAPYAAALDKYDPGHYLIRANEYQTMAARGNLLLLVDRGHEAREIFQEMAKTAHDNVERIAANAGIARSIKAESGCIGPADRWVLSLRERP